MVNKFLHANGGAETYVFKLGDYLKEKGHEVQYFGMNHENRLVGNAVESYTDNMDFHGRFGLGKLLYPVKTIYSAEARKRLRPVLEDFCPDVVHLNNFNYQLTPSVILEVDKWRKKTGHRCRIVFTAHDYQLVCPNHMLYRPGMQQSCERCLGGAFQNCVSGRCIHGSLPRSVVGAAEAYYWNRNGVYKYIDTMICCSEFMKKKLDSNSLFASKTVVLHNFMETVEWKDIPRKDYVLYFGRFSREKGIPTLLRVCRELPDISFVFAGSGPLEGELKGIPNVVNVGFQQGEALERLIREARFSVYPSEWYENCPFSVMESQAYGTPVLGADTGGIPELIQPGKTGELFQSGNARELETQIRRLWEDRERTEQYSRNCRQLQFLSLEDYYQKLMGIYRGTGMKQKIDRKREKINWKRKKIDRKTEKISRKRKKMDWKAEKKLNGTVIVTYRCNARCSMCNRYQAPSRPEEEISIETIRKLPRMYFTNVTGGEPFIRADLKEIVRELYKKSDRIVISTNGFFTDRILDLCREFPDVGIRISIEGLEKTNNEIRGLEDGFRRGYTTLKRLVAMGMKDVGFGMTIQDRNAQDLLALYRLSDQLGMEFATASLHNSFYFVEAKNQIHDRPAVAHQIERLVNELLRSNHPKKWFRAYFNHGLINYIYGQKRLLPCDMSFDTFFIDPYGDVMPCNGTKDKEVMGNLNRQTWEQLWNSKEAEAVRKKVRCCDRECWMIGSVSPAMRKYIWKPAWWVIQHKFLRFWKKKKYSMYENRIVRNYRDGKVTKEQLDLCSTCDWNGTAYDGLSKASREQLKHKTGEEIVAADLAAQKQF